MTNLRVELDNIRGALQYAAENDPEGGLRLAGASWELRSTLAGQAPDYGPTAPAD